MVRAIALFFSTLTGIIIIDKITGRKLINKHKQIGVFGKPGTGKSTLLTAWIYKHIKRGWEVYSDTENNIPGCRFFNGEDFKKGDWLPDGRKGYINEEGKINEENRNILIVFDEIGILYNNRSFRDNLNPKTLDFWKRHRHRRVKIIYGSQSYKDMDLKIRQLTDTMYLVNRSFLRNFSIAKPILIKMDIANNENTENAGGQIVEKYNYDIFIFWKLIPLRKWITKFDSYN